MQTKSSIANRTIAQTTGPKKALAPPVYQPNPKPQVLQRSTVAGSRGQKPRAVFSKRQPRLFGRAIQLSSSPNQQIDLLNEEFEKHRLLLDQLRQQQQQSLVKPKPPQQQQQQQQQQPKTTSSNEKKDNSKSSSHSQQQQQQKQQPKAVTSNSTSSNNSSSKYSNKQQQPKSASSSEKKDGDKGKQKTTDYDEERNVQDVAEAVKNFSLISKGITETTETGPAGKFNLWTVPFQILPQQVQVAIVQIKIKNDLEELWDYYRDDFHSNRGGHLPESNYALLTQPTSKQKAYHKASSEKDPDKKNYVAQYAEFHVTKSGLGKAFRLLYDYVNDHIYISLSHYNIWSDKGGKERNPFFRVVGIP